ncbi:MAG TPA: hypothetical protein VNJ54_05810 [Plantibacter sp.]|uniref:hypothetical protein n=1 Tax=unclassified Plantibacter TaxID=2624265 RepID=UPI002B537DA1|nr:hypothetical protein [Plantibacter sp.]
MWSVKTHKVAASAVAVGGVLLIVGAATTIGGVVSSASAGSSAREQLSLLNAPRNAQDSLPRSIHTQSKGIGDGGLATDSTRFLGEDESAQYWTGIDTAGHVCVIAELNMSGVWSSACTNAHQFANTGLGLSVDRPDEANPEHAEAYLLPDGVVLDEIPHVLAYTADNLLTGDTRLLSERARRDGLTSSTSDFALQLIPTLGNPVE